MCEKLLDCFARRREYDEHVLLLAAHPDDEVIGAGAVLPLLRRLVIAHVTDGAPRNMQDAIEHGFSDRDAYRLARRSELERALSAACIQPDSLIELGIADQEATHEIVPLALRVRQICDAFGVSVVLTHSYEGGHPDHDATACAVQLARRFGRHFDVVEFTSYHLAGGRFVTESFLDNRSAITVDLTPSERARKQAMLDCFTTQRDTLSVFGVGTERFRVAPAYDFRQPPCERPLLYEHFPWGTDWPGFRAAVSAAHRTLVREAAA